MLRGVMTGFMARPTAKTSIGKVFQDRAARYADKVFLSSRTAADLPRGQRDRQPLRGGAGRARVGHGDVVGVMLRNSPQTVLLMLAAVKCGAIAGMLNYHQRGDVLKHSIGLLDAKAVVAETDFDRADHRKRRRHHRADDARGAGPARCDRPDPGPRDDGRGAGQGQGVLHLHVGHHGHAEGQRDDPLPMAARAGRLRRPGPAVAQQRHDVLLPAALSQQRADGGARIDG